MNMLYIASYTVDETFWKEVNQMLLRQHDKQ